MREARPGATCFDQPDNIVGQVRSGPGFKMS